MNILIVSYFHKNEMMGGGEICAYNYANNLSKSNNVYYLNSQINYNNGNIKFLKFKGMRRIPFFNSLFQILYFIFYIIKFDIQEIHSFDRLTTIASIISSKIMRIKSKVTIQDYWFCCNQSTKYHNGFFCNGSLKDELKSYSIFRWPWEIYKYFSMLFARFLLKKTKVISISKHIKKELKKYNINSSVEYNIIDKNLIKKSKLLKKYKNKKIILYAGRLSHEKGIHILINSFKKLDNKNILLIIIGTGLEFEYLKKLKGKNKNILFLGRLEKISEVYDYFKSSKVIVYPVLWDEPYGRVIAEAKLFNKFIISTKSGGIVEQLINYDKGFLIKKNSEIELTKILKKIL